MKNLKVLIITYYWPPSGGPAVQRWLAFTNLLAKKGLKLFVITVDENTANYPSIDNSLEAHVSSKIKILKTITSEVFWIYKKFIGKGKAPSAGFANEGKPNLIQKISRFIRGNFFIPDPRKSWNKYVKPVAEDIITKENIDLIITAGPPHSTHLNGLKLQKKFGIKWIADFHDAWTDVWYYEKLMHTTWAHKKDLSLERKVLEKADKVITVGKLLRQKLASKSLKIDINNISVISMGFDENFFTQQSNPPTDFFIITYAGTIDDHYEPQVLFRALKVIKERNPDINYKIRFVGLLAEGLKQDAIKIGLEENLEQIGYVPHEESVRYLFSSTVLLLVSAKGKSEEIIIPGKVYEYLASRKPIINVGLLSCDTARIIAECDAGINVDRNMDKQLIDYLQELSNAWKINPNLDLNHSNKNYLKYSRNSEAEQLYSLILETIAVE